MFSKNTQIFIPGLLSDARVWRPLAENLDCVDSSYFVDVSNLQSLRGMAQNILDTTSGFLDVFGHSMGGRIALELFDLAPERVASLILADTGVHPLAENEVAKRESVIRIGHEEGMSNLCDSWLPPMVAADNKKDKGLMFDLREMVLEYSATQHENQIRALMGRNNAELYLHHINCPVLLVVGSDDSWSSPEQHYDIAFKIKNACVEVIDGAGHFAPVENVDVFASAVKSWYRSAVMPFVNNQGV